MSFSGHIVEVRGTVYFVPTDSSVAALEWCAKDQRFEPLDTSAPTGQTVAETLRTLIDAEQHASLSRSTSTTVGAQPSAVTFCHALYGVLSLGATDAVVLYVTEKKHTSSLFVENPKTPHDIFLVTDLAWRALPSVPCPGKAATPDAEADDAAPTEKSSDDDEDGGCPVDAQPRRLPRPTLLRYHRVVDEFCAYVKKDHGAHSFLYFSPTLNLAENPKDIIDAQLWRQHDFAEMANDAASDSPACSDGADDRGDDANADAQPHDAYARGSSGPVRTPQDAVALFQWNLSLLQAFAPISPVFTSRTARRLLPGHSSVKRVTRNIAGFYVPSFIRGLALSVSAANSTNPSLASASDTDSVQMTMITRLSARFAGTRYNRRGLETGWSGVCANMAMTALWVTSQTHTTVVPRRIAVYEILRGSVPRHWTQPANLSFKPPIRMSSTNSAVRELRSHLDLLTRVFPQYDRYYFVDTTSTSKLERPLSDSYCNTVSSLQARDASAPLTQGGRTYVDRFFYLKYNVKQKKKKMQYHEMRLNLATVIEESLEDLHEQPTTPSFAPACGLWNDFLLYAQESPGGGDVSASSVAGAWQLLKEQVVLIRVNCLDNLDRTNLTQSMLATTVLPNILKALTRAVVPLTSTPDVPATADADEAHRVASAERSALTLFAAQGVSISQLYAGTDPHFLNYMLGSRADGITDHFHEGLLALGRWYNNNFYDGRKQDAVSLITGQHNPARYAAEIENPFSRDLSTMNRRVWMGVAVGVIAFVLSALSLFTATDVAERRVRALLTALWITYVVVLVRRLAPYQQSLTNRPLLAYAP